MSNDSTIRFEYRLYQLGKPIYPWERGGKVVVEVRLDGSMAIRLEEHYLKYHEIALRNEAPGGSAPSPRSLAPIGQTPGEENEDSVSSQATESCGVQPADMGSGRPSVEPYPADDDDAHTKQGPCR